ncbi:hypothetical protein GCM10010466_29350 [Planomonospora alba]|uniref:Uncharacterized protein n=1 Tax=Planomonospora alba TaxID=161354 RepID=A0ABP6N4Z5_9ACTN
MGEHSPAVEADLARFYGVDLVDLYRGRISLRKVYSLVSSLPYDSATHKAVLGEAAAWGSIEHLLAATVDELRVSNWLFQRVNFEQNPPTPAPEPLPRPGLSSAPEPEPEHTKFLTATELRSYLAGLG